MHVVKMDQIKIELSRIKLQACRIKGNITLNSKILVATLKFHAL